MPTLILTEDGIEELRPTTITICPVCLATITNGKCWNCGKTV